MKKMKMTKKPAAMTKMSQSMRTGYSKMPMAKMPKGAMKKAKKY